MISVYLNGNARQFEHPITITDLISLLDLSGKRIAIECNGKIIPRSLFQEYLLADGDKIEVVVAVGGG